MAKKENFSPISGPLLYEEQIRFDAQGAKRFLQEQRLQEEQKAERFAREALFDDFSPLDFIPPDAPPLIECVTPAEPMQDIHFQEFDFFGGEEGRARTEFAYIQELLRRPPVSFASIVANRFEGDGIYAISYHGPLAIYAPIRSALIYNGKAAQEGARALWRRLTENHLQSLQQTGLGPENFTVRFLICPGWQAVLVENLIKEVFHPLWTCHLKGFGARLNSKESKNREQTSASDFDTYHEGRDGAGPIQKSREAIELQIKKSLDQCVFHHNKAMLRFGVNRVTPQEE